MLSSEALGLIVQICFFGGFSLSLGFIIPFFIYKFFINKNFRKKGGLRGVNIKKVK